MLKYGIDSLPIDDVEVRRHWHLQSEPFTGADSLLTALHRGWKIGEVVYRQEFWHGGVRLVNIYHFDLKRDGQAMVMPVITNPYVTRILESLPLQVLSIDTQKSPSEALDDR